MEKKNKKQKVFVALSGGVDSAVSAALLKNQGHRAVGIFMRLGKTDLSAESAAKKVAKKLDIEFLVFDFRQEFKKTVIDYFLKELKNGRTPNPCVVCNPQIKFGLFLEKALKMGADYIATGHYAQVVVIPSVARNLARIGGFNPVAGIRQRSFAIAQDDKLDYKLLAAKDKTKDQSYFLYRLNQRQLSRVIFPLGNLLKSEVYKIAQKMKLPYRQGESFDICFVDDYRQFLKKYLKIKPGKIMNMNCHPELDSGSRSRNEFGMTAGVVLGEHQGLPFFTLGQRASVGGPGPFYVVKKDGRKNILYVSNNKKDLYQKEILVEKVKWVSNQIQKLPLKCKIKIRYRGEATPAVIASVAEGDANQPRIFSTVHGIATSFATLTPRNDRVRIIFDKPQWAPTPGQSAVFYGKKGEVLGGGIVM